MRTLPFGTDLNALLDLYRKGLPRGSSTGWSAVDRHYTVGPSQWTVITGIPNHGKSEWLDALLVNLLDRPLDGKPWKFLICSPENWPLQVHESKLLEKVIGKRFGDGPSNRMTEAELRGAAENVMRNRFTFAELDEGETFPDLLIGIREFAAASKRHQVGIVLDPWNQLEHCRPAGLSETEYISEALSAAIRITRATGAHLFIVAHPAKLFRDKEGNRPVPTPYDISGSAHWFNKADNCITVWRNVHAEPGDADYGVVHIHVQKVRFKHIGYPGLAYLRYELATGRYSDLASVAPHGSDRKSAAAGEKVDL
jgi:twinkle protein